MQIEAKNISIELDKIYSGFANYPIIATTDDGGCLCEKCVKENIQLIEASYEKDGWHVIDLECDQSDSIYCDNCGMDASGNN